MSSEQPVNEPPAEPDQGTATAEPHKDSATVPPIHERLAHWLSELAVYIKDTRVCSFANALWSIIISPWWIVIHTTLLVLIAVYIRVGLAEVQRQTPDPRCSFCTPSTVGLHNILPKNDVSGSHTLVVCRGGTRDLNAPSPPIELPVVCQALCMEPNPIDSVYPSARTSFVPRRDPASGENLNLPTDVHIYGRVSRTKGSCEEYTLVQIRDSQTAQKIVYDLVSLSRSRNQTHGRSRDFSS